MMFGFLIVVESVPVLTTRAVQRNVEVRGFKEPIDFRFHRIYRRANILKVQCGHVRCPIGSHRVVVQDHSKEPQRVARGLLSPTRILEQHHGVQRGSRTGPFLFVGAAGGISDLFLGIGGPFARIKVGTGVKDSDSFDVTTSTVGLSKTGFCYIDRKVINNY